MFADFEAGGQREADLRWAFARVSEVWYDSERRAVVWSSIYEYCLFARPCFLLSVCCCVCVLCFLWSSYIRACPACVSQLLLEASLACAWHSFIFGDLSGLTSRPPSWLLVFFSLYFLLLMTFCVLRFLTLWCL